MPSFVLYTSPLSQHGRRVVSLFEEAKIPYDTRLVALEKGAHLQEDYARINPNRQVPALMVDGEVLLESHAIMRYAADTHGLESWYPKDAWKRAQVDQWLDWNHYRVGPTVSALVVNKVMLGDAGDASVIARSQESLKAVFPILDAHLSARDYLVGDAPTLADLSVFSNWFQLGFSQDQPEGANIAAWAGRLMERDGVRASLPPAP